MNLTLLGHISAITTIIIWGTTFVSTKVLLNQGFTPIEILFYRFLMGLIALWVIHPKRMTGTSRSQELYFAAAGLCGVTLYFLFENIALTYTLASNVGVIVCVSPFVTALLARHFLEAEKPGLFFYIGFLIAISGVFLISFNSNMTLDLNPIGDLLAILAALVWAIYSILIKKISTFGYNTIETTRTIFFYGILLMIPALFFLDFKFEITQFYDLTNLLNILFLGLGASALCFVSWSFSVKILGAVKTSVYIYSVPAITVLTSALILKEPITLLSSLGMILTIIGLFISERKSIPTAIKEL